MIVSVTELKEQLNQTLSVDDTLIGRKIAAAQNHIERLLGVDIEATYGGAGQDPIPDALKEAVSLLAAHWYENREASVIGLSTATIPFGVHELVREYREFSYGV